MALIYLQKRARIVRQLAYFVLRCIQKNKPRRSGVCVSVTKQ